MDKSDYYPYRKRGILAFSIFIAFASVSCSGLDYRPATPFDRAGYTDGQVSAQRFYATYAGNVDEQVATSLALRRAAEVTRAQGRRWFQAVGLEINGGEASLVILQMSFGRQATGPRGGLISLGRIPSDEPLTAVIEFVLLDAEPVGVEHVFDADVILATENR